MLIQKKIDGIENKSWVELSIEMTMHLKLNAFLDGLHHAQLRGDVK